MLDKPGFEYVSIVLGTSYLIPQIIVGYRKKRLSDVSTVSLIMLIGGTLLWSYYLYSRLEEFYFAYATCFITFNAVILLCMKYTYYVLDLKKKIKAVEENAV